MVLSSIKPGMSAVVVAGGIHRLLCEICALSAAVPVFARHARPASGQSDSGGRCVGLSRVAASVTRAVRRRRRRLDPIEPNSAAQRLVRMSRFD